MALKIHKVHEPLYYSPKRYVYEKGGRGSGKSTAVTDYARRMTYSKDRVLLFMRYTMESASISIIPEFEENMLRTNSKEDFTFVNNTIVNIHTGSKIIFKGVKTSSLTQTANLKSIHGLTDVIYDEFEEHPDKESFDKLDESIRSVLASNKLVLVSNALKKDSWQSKEFWNKEGFYYDMTEHIFTTYQYNYDNLSDSWHEKRKKVRELNPKKYDRDYLGKDYSDDDGGIFWNRKILNRYTIDTAPQMKRIVVAIDPATSKTADSDETGIIVCGLDNQKNGYVLEDVSGKYSPNEWSLAVTKAVTRWDADCIVAEKNQGGDMVENIIRQNDKKVRVKLVTATKGKQTRAEPIFGLYEQGKAYHHGSFPVLESQMISFNPNTNKNSPDRVDALVWGFTELMLNFKGDNTITFSNLPTQRRRSRR